MLHQLDGWWGPGQSHRAPRVQKGPHLVSCSVVAVLKFLIWMQGHTFSFCTRLHKVCSQFYDQSCRKEIHVLSSSNIAYICSSSNVHGPIAQARPWLRIEGGLTPTRWVIPSSCQFQAPTGKYITDGNQLYLHVSIGCCSLQTHLYSMVIFAARGYQQRLYQFIK